MDKQTKKRSFYQKWWFWVIVAIVAISAYSGGGTEEKATEKKTPEVTEKTQTSTEVTKEEPKKEEPKKEAPKKDGISKAEFEQIQNGMTYDEVKGIVGSEGELQSESEVAGYKTVMYMFKGESGIGSNATMMFQNNELTSKSQFGLK